MIPRFAFRAAVAGILSVATLAVAMAAAPADERPSCPMMDGGRMPAPMMMAGAGGKWLQQLDLSAEQRSKIQTIMQEQHKQRTEHMETMRHGMTELHQLAQAPQFDAAKAKQMTAEHGKQMGERMFEHLQTEAQVRAVLTPEQRKKLDEKTAAWHEHHRGQDEHRSHHCQ